MSIAGFIMGGRGRGVWQNEVIQAVMRAIGCTVSIACFIMAGVEGMKL